MEEIKTSSKKNKLELIRIFNLTKKELGSEYILANNQCEGYNSDMLQIRNSGELEEVTISIVEEKGKETRTRINIWAYPCSDWNKKYIRFLERLKNEYIWINSSDDNEDYGIEDAIHFIWATHTE